MGKQGMRAVDLLSIGLINAVLVGGGMGLGWVVDDRLGTQPIWTLVGILAGVLLGVVATVRLIRTFL